MPKTRHLGRGQWRVQRQRQQNVQRSVQHRWQLSTDLCKCCIAVREVQAALAMQLQWWMEHATTMGTPAILMVLVAMETTIENFLIVIVSQIMMLAWMATMTSL